MPKYLILKRTEKDPKAHAHGSTELTACEIAKELMYFDGPVDNLMAIDAIGPAATFAHLEDSTLCSIHVDEESQYVWNNEIPEIEESLRNFEFIKNQAENDLNDALRQMQEKFAESSAFSEIDPEDGIGVYSALEALGYDDIDFKFRRALQKQFQFEEMIGMFK